MTKNDERDTTAGRVDLNAEGFFGDVIGLLAENLEETVGLEDAASFVAAVGGRLGEVISDKYAQAGNDACATDRAAAIAAVCVDLKARIGGGFEVESIDDDKIVFTNRCCPFGSRVEGRPSLCMMTTTVFGRVAADRNGYASVHVDEAIATGHRGCRVIVRLTPDDDDVGHEFFR